jgi:hypothetical protein
MENLTFALKLVRQHIVRPLEGHSVVVLQPVGANGEVFRFLLRPDERPPKNPFHISDLFHFLKREPVLYAFAVTDDSEQRVASNVDVTTRDIAQAFTVSIVIDFRVIDPRLLVLRRLDDPVRRLKTMVETVTARELGQREWSQMVRQFSVIEREIVASTLGRLRQYGSEYGLWVTAISLTICDNESAQIQSREETTMESHAMSLEAFAEARVSHQREIGTRSRSGGSVFDAAIEAAAKAVVNAGSAITTVEELTRAVELLRTTESQLLSLRGHSGFDAVSPPHDVNREHEDGRRDIKVAFRAIWQSDILEQTASQLAVYAYVGSEGAMAVANDIRRSVQDPRATSGGATSSLVQAGARIRVAPSAPCIHFNPPYTTLPELSTWSRAEFEMRIHSLPRNPQEQVFGRIEFFVGPLIVGHLAFSVNVVPADRIGEDRRSEVGFCDAQGPAHRKIFVSYCRRDMAVIKQLERAYKVLGDSYLRDIDVLRSGDDWRRSLGRWIGEADVFQLCWSRAARLSRNVEEEWRGALSLGRSGFIHPVYWQKPLPKPPTELANLHFAFYDMPRRMPKRPRPDTGVPRVP